MSRMSWMKGLYVVEIRDLGVLVSMGCGVRRNSDIYGSRESL